MWHRGIGFSHLRLWISFKLMLLILWVVVESNFFEGSVARITCRAVNRYEIETAPFSFLSGATDANGYFLATLSPSEVNNNMRLTGCKAYLELSSSDTCLFPTDVNKGITGVTLASYRLVNNRKIKLFTVGPFFFTSEPESTPNGRY